MKTILSLWCVRSLFRLALLVFIAISVRAQSRGTIAGSGANFVIQFTEQIESASVLAGPDTAMPSGVPLDYTLVSTSLLTLVSATADCSRNVVTATFSVPLDVASASAAANYKISGGVSVTSVVLAPDGQTVSLFTTQ